MNDFERRFYSEPDTRNISVGQLSIIKEMFQKILTDMQAENPYMTVSDILKEDAEEETDVNEF